MINTAVLLPDHRHFCYQTRCRCLKLSSLKIAVGIWLGLLLVGCADDELSPEDQIRAQIAVMEKAADERRVDDFMQYIASGYSDNKGLTRKKAERLVRLRLFQQSDVHVFTHITSIDVDESTSTEATRANVVVYAGAAKGAFTSLSELTDMSVDLMRFNMQFKRNDDRWLIEASTWYRASLDELY